MRSKTPLIASDAFYRATQEMMFNETAFNIKHDPQAVPAIADELRRMGQRRFINMTSGTQDARVSLVLYAGDGIVTKIMPDSYSGTEHPYQLPAITSSLVETEDRQYRINTYPYVPSRGETKADVEEYREIMGELGLKIHEGDDTTRNLRRLPDNDGTLVGIDADMFSTMRGGLQFDDELQQAWFDYLAELYPMYEHGIPRQTSETSFAIMSPHDRNAKLLGFDHTCEDPIIRLHENAPKAEQSGGRSFWSYFGIHNG